MSMNSAYGSTGADFVRNLGDAARRNPISTALIGMGVLWLISGGKPVDTATRLARRGYDRLPDGAADWIDSGASAVRGSVAAVSNQLSGVTGSAGDAMQKASSVLRDTGAAARDRVSQLTSQVGDVASDLQRRIPERSADLFGSARERLGDMFEEQPLLLGAVGLAIGAGIAASLPATSIEAKYFGEQADELKAKAAAFAGEKTQALREMADQALDAAGDEAGRLGLTPEGVKAAAGEIGGKLSGAADAARGRLGST